MLNKGTSELRIHYQNEIFTENDFNGTILRIDDVNILLYGISNPTFENRNSISDKNPNTSKY